MERTLMHGLNQRDMDAVVHSYNLNAFYYPTLFPIKETKTLEWKMLEAKTGLKIAGDIIARGASIPRKTREAIEKIQGDIPKVVASRIMEEEELTEYDIFIAMASGNSDLQAIVEFWAEDTQFCFDGVAAKIEWMALREISLGKLDVNDMNNAAVVTEFGLNYQMSPWQKVGVKKSFANVDADVYAEFAKVQKLGKKNVGATYKFAFMNLDTYTKIAQLEKVIKTCATVAQNLTGTEYMPDVASFNASLMKRPDMKGLQVRIIDQEIVHELANGTKTDPMNPFEDDVILFSESEVLGNTFYKVPIDMKLKGSKALMTLHGHTLIKKYSTDDIVTEVTEGIANAFPAWNLSGRSVLMQVNSTTWNKN